MYKKNPVFVPSEAHEAKYVEKIVMDKDFERN